MLVRHDWSVVAAAVLAMVAVLWCAPAVGDDCHWQGAGTGGNTATDPADATTLWCQPGNWVEGAAPGPGDSACFDLTNAGAVNAETTTVGEVHVRGASPDATVTIGDGVDMVVANSLHVADAGGSAGTVVQTGGKNTVSWSVSIGSLPGDLGRYELAGGQIIGYDITLGLLGGGTFAHSGGTCEMTLIRLAADAGGTGTYELSGTGTIDVGVAYIGHYASGWFSQSGGVNATGAVVLGDRADGTGTYAISGGTLTTDRLIVSSPGSSALDISDPAARIEVAILLRFGPAGHLRAVPASKIHMTGAAFTNEVTTPADMAGLAELVMIFEGGAAEVDPFEVAGEDRGATRAGYADNFALGTLRLGGADVGQVQLVDDVDNRPAWAGDEALYVMNLDLAAGSLLDLNGRKLYYLTGRIDPGATILGGSPTAVPVLGGDATLDGVVAYLDIGAVASNYGRGDMNWRQGDFTGDGIVNYQDVGVLSTNYGASGGAGAEVPEPTALALLACAAGLALRRARRRD